MTIKEQRYPLSTLVIVLVLSICPIFSHAEILVVVHSSNTVSIDKKDIAKLFLGKRSKFPGGAQAIPINQAAGSATTENFNASVLKRSQAQLKAYWTKLVFTGKGSPPKEVSDDVAVINLVKENPSVIGYVSSEADVTDVNVVEKF